jgi:hypothetical protein
LVAETAAQDLLLRAKIFVRCCHSGAQEGRRRDFLTARLQGAAPPQIAPTASVRPAAALLAQIESLRAELAEARRMAAGHRADFERERDRGDRLAADLGAIAARMTRPWWRRLAS